MTAIRKSRTSRLFINTADLCNGTYTFVEYSDDYPDLGSDSRIINPLLPGDYIALVSPYSGSCEDEVAFSWSEDEEGINTLRVGRSTEVYVPYETETIIYKLNLQAGRRQYPLIMITDNES